MKKRITATVIALLFTILCLPMSLFTTGTVVSAEKNPGQNDVLTDNPEGIDTSAEYSIVSCLSEYTAIDLKAENLKDIQLYNSNGSQNQTWILSKVGDYYTISCKKSGGVIEVPGGNATAGQLLEANKPDGSDKQLWRLELTEDGSYAIHSKLKDSLVFDVTGSSTANGTRILLWNNAKRNNQRFRLIKRSDPDKENESVVDYDFESFDLNADYAIVTCLDEEKYVTYNRPRYGRTGVVDIEIDFGHGNDQLWNLRKDGDYYTFISKYSGDAIDIPEGKAADENEIECREYTGSDSQKWRIESMGDGSYVIRSKLDDKFCWWVEDDENKDGADIVLYNYGKRDSQRFRIINKSAQDEEKKNADKAEGGLNTNAEYTIVSCLDENIAIDLKAENIKDIQLYKSNGSENQTWTLKKYGEYYTISSKKTGGVIEVPGGNAKAGQLLEANTFDGSDKQLWRLELTDDGSYSIHCKTNDNLVFDVTASSTSNGTRIIIWNNAKGVNQRFRFVRCPGSDNNPIEDDLKHYGSDHDYIIVPCSDENAAVAYMPAANGAKEAVTVHRKADSGYAHLLWRLRKVSDYYVIECKEDGKAVDVPGGKAENGAELQRWSSNETDAQKWRLEPMSDGSYVIHSKLDYKLCWDLKDNTSTNDTPVQLNGRKAVSSQRFRFIRIKDDDLFRYGENEEYVIVSCLNEDTVVSYMPADSGEKEEVALYGKDIKLSHQRWKLRKNGGYYTFECKENGKVIDVPGGNAVSDNVLQRWNSNGTDAQKWRLEALDDGTYIIHSKLNDTLCWDVRYASDEDGSVIQLFSRHAGNNQKFRFVLYSKVKAELDEEARKNADADDLEIYGLNEDYIIVPCNNRSSALTYPSSGSQNSPITINGKVSKYANQIWRLSKEGDYYTIECKNGGKVIDVPGGKANKSAELQRWGSNGTDAQKWRLEPMGDGSYVIHSKLNDNLCWDVKGESAADNTPVMLYDRHARSNQRFRFVCVTGESTESGAYEADELMRYGLDEEYCITSVRYGAYSVDLNGNNQLTTYRTHRKTNQRWKLKKVGDYYAIISLMNGKVIDVPDGKAEQNKGLQSYNYNGTDAQLWRLEKMGDGSYIIHSKLNDNLVWDATGDFRLILYGRHAEGHQRFRFIHVSTTEPMSEWGSSRQDCHGSDFDIWNGSVNDFGFYDNHKNEEDLYIYKASELGGLITLVNNGWSMASKTIHLMRDIDLREILWTPIGTGDNWFRGSFNGHNHTIIGLKNDQDWDEVGLFGKVKGGMICNLAVKGRIRGDYQVGGIVGLLEEGSVVNVYSEVKIENATDDREGGICGAMAYGGMVDHCTQNATVNSNDNDNHRGGIAGVCDGHIRYSVNNATVNHNWNYGGGIAGFCGRANIEFCANHGTVGGGNNSEHIGGIVGQMNSGFIIGCFNDGQVCSTDDDYIGGICGYEDNDWCVIGCVNDGRVYGREYIGGLCGEGRPIKCLNMGVVTGSKKVGAIAGNARNDTPYCYALAYSSASLHGESGSRADWVTAMQIVSGEVCYDMVRDNVTTDWFNIPEPVSQNIGSDPYPTFGSSKVIWNGNSYANEKYQVTIDTKRSYGRVRGGKSYSAGQAVTLTAIPAPGCLFDHYEVISSDETSWTGFNGNQYYHPTVRVRKYKSSTLKLTKDIRQSYTVRAVFKVYDSTPADMKVTVKLELECTDDADGWNSDIIPVDLVDSSGEMHHWEVSTPSLDGDGKKVSHTFDIGSASHVAVYAYPDFGGGFTFHGLGLKARIWINGSGNAMESQEVMIRSWPFISSKHNDDYMNISFENFGNSTVGGSSYSRCVDAWNAARGSSQTLRLESAWLLDGVLEISSGQTVNLDLNGFPIIRALKKTDDDGELIKINAGATLNITDSCPDRKSCGNFNGGSIQGGRSDNTAGLIECLGKLNMNGGTLYNGGTTDKGGAIKLSGSAEANLNGVLISDCWSDKAITYQNEGGAIYMKESAKANLKNCTIRFCHALDYGGGIYLEDDNNRLYCENVDILTCKTEENQGAGVYQDHGETKWIGGSIKSCRAGEDHGGGFYQNNGKAYFENVSFEENYAEDNGGAFYSDTNDGLWFLNCKFIKNRSDDDGGAIYKNKENFYMENCTVTSNTARTEGGGIYVDSSGAITMGGRMIIRSNDGEEKMDNLVIEKGAYLYNAGLEPGSEVWLRSESDGNVTISGSKMSEYQFKNYFHADYSRIELTDKENVDTDIRASIFSEGTSALYIGAGILILALIGGIIYRKKRQKEGAL